MLSSLVVAALLGASLPGQPVEQYGVASGPASGAAPRISVIGAPRVGDLGFGLRIEGAQPSVNAFLLISTGLDELQFQNLTLLVDITTQPAIFLGPFQTLADGSFTYALPVENMQSLVGVRLYAQWVSQDPSVPSGLVSTRGVRFSVRAAGEAVILSSSEGLEVQQAGVVTDFEPFTSPPLTGSGTRQTSLTISPDGRTVASARAAPGPNIELELLDYDAGGLTSLMLPLALSESVIQAGFHPTADELYVLHGTPNPPMPTVPVTVTVLDVDRDSPGFGAELRSIQISTGPGPRLFFGPDGRRMVVEFLGGLSVIDVDPTSASRDSVLATYPSVGGLVVAPSPDGSSVYVLAGANLNQIGLADGLVQRTVVLPLPALLFTAGAISSSGTLGVTAFPATQVAVFDPDLDSPTFDLFSSPISIRALTFTAAGDRVLLLEQNDFVQIDLATATTTTVPASNLTDLQDFVPH